MTVGESIKSRRATLHPCAAGLALVFATEAVGQDSRPELASYSNVQLQERPAGEAFKIDDERLAPDLALISVSRAADLVGTPMVLKLTAAPGTGKGTGAVPNFSPLMGARLTSEFGSRLHPILKTWRSHSGVDLAAPSGSPVRATADGSVSIANWNGGYGLFISLKHPGGVETDYGHMSRLNVVAGQTVKRGDIIGFVGSTGLSTGPHLHYEVRIDGKAINPTSALP